MKVLTIKNPWATLIVKGYKKYEFRSWNTNYRGKILIHAGLSLDKEVITKFEKYSLNYINGAIIGEADLVDCILVDNELSDKLNKTNPLIYGNNDKYGNYGWKL